MDGVGDGVEEAFIRVVNENQFHRVLRDSRMGGTFEFSGRGGKLCLVNSGTGLLACFVTGKMPVLHLNFRYEEGPFGAGVAFDGFAGVGGVEKGFEGIEGHPIGAALLGGGRFGDIG